MLMIVAHHFVVNSGFTGADGPLTMNPSNPNTLFLYLFGMWGKTGINCFLLITGYFMCKSTITLRKFLKLMLQIYLYNIVIFVILAFAGYQPISLASIIKLAMPVWDFDVNFTSCFIGFWLTIPFWNILIQNMTRRQHQLLLSLLLGMYTILGTVPKFNIAMNYVTWFGVIYLISSYIRLYPHPIFEKKSLWGWLTLATVLISMASVLTMHSVIGRGEFWFVSDSNKFFAVAIAVVSFLWFKNMKMPQSKLINAIGGSTFGVLLIHANSDAMRTWLWKDTVDCTGHFGLSLPHLILFSIGVIAAVFFSCIIIDRIRIFLLEKPFFTWFDKKTEARSGN